MPSGIDRYKLWEFIAYAWTEIGIEEDECLSLAHEAGISPATLDQADQIVFRPRSCLYFSRSVKVLRNLATFGATTKAQ